MSLAPRRSLSQAYDNRMRNRKTLFDASIVIGCEIRGLPQHQIPIFAAAGGPLVTTERALHCRFLTDPLPRRIYESKLGRRSRRVVVAALARTRGRRDIRHPAV